MIQPPGRGTAFRTSRYGWLIIAIFAVLAFLWIRSIHRDNEAMHSATTKTRLDTALNTGIGDTATVRQGQGFWPCGSTPDALEELMKWAARGDKEAVTRTLFKTKSIGIVGGMQVKILDSRGFLSIQRRVRVLTNDAGEARLKDEQGEFSADPRIGRECWVASEALTR